MDDTGPGSETGRGGADLYRELREADLARDADPDPARRRVGWRLDVAAGGLHSAAEELLATANELVRLAFRRADACLVPWGACPEHGDATVHWRALLVHRPGLPAPLATQPTRRAVHRARHPPRRRCRGR